MTVWALDFYQDKLGIGGHGIAAVLGCVMLLVILVELLRALRDASRYRGLLPVFLGVGMFWWAVWTGHLWVGMATLFAGMAPMTIANMRASGTAKKAAPLQNLAIDQSTMALGQK